MTKVWWLSSLSLSTTHPFISTCRPSIEGELLYYFRIPSGSPPYTMPGRAHPSFERRHEPMALILRCSRYVDP